jgi:hypothetical protein
MDLDQRIFTAASGRRIRVSLAPRERRSGGVESTFRSIVFEVDNGEWIGSAPIMGGRSLWSLSGEEVQIYFQQAQRWDLPSN